MTLKEQLIFSLKLFKKPIRKSSQEIFEDEMKKCIKLLEKCIEQQEIINALNKIMIEKQQQCF